MSRCAQVGGQAVIEGVMMRAPNSLAVAVRRPDGEIVVKEGVWQSIWDRLRFLRWPFLRGVVVMAEAMVNGMQALNFSAAESLTEEEKEKEQQGGDSGGWLFAVPLIISLVLFFGVFKLLPHLAATYAGDLFVGRKFTVNDNIYHVVDGVVKMAIFIAYVGAISLLKDIRRVFMYHGAEHMSIYALEAGEPLTVAYARTKSPLHPRCGTSFLVVVILIFIVVSAVLLPFLPEWAKPGEGKPFYVHLLVALIKLPLLLPVAGIAYEFNRWAGRHTDNWLVKLLTWPGLLMQMLTTRRPTDDQLEVALTALRTALWREETGEAVPDTEAPRVYEHFDAVVAQVQPSDEIIARI
ncbi:MAG: DUF1385 domain-containing protein [Proteobacteria bacterium]|nr:DUF1385 domain-containing protein [Pseudomonadota bacterium]